MRPQRGVDRTIATRLTVGLAQSSWAPVPLVFFSRFARLEVSPTEGLLLLQLLSFKWDERMPFPTVGALAKRVGLTTRAVRSALSRLESKALLKRVPKGRRNAYDLSGFFTALEGLLDGARTPLAQLITDHDQTEAETSEVLDQLDEPLDGHRSAIPPGPLCLRLAPHRQPPVRFSSTTLSLSPPATVERTCSSLSRIPSCFRTRSSW